MKVGSLFKRAIVALDAGGRLRQAAKGMLARRVGALLVTVEGEGRRDVPSSSRRRLFLPVADTAVPR